MKKIIITAKYSGPSGVLRSQLNKYEIYKNDQPTGLFYGADNEEEAIEMYYRFTM
tara:strand:+ start:414 stop:578 length:165 start_codon:yes stop_codon:yes gene_type:complete